MALSSFVCIIHKTSLIRKTHEIIVSHYKETYRTKGKKKREREGIAQVVQPLGYVNFTI